MAFLRSLRSQSLLLLIVVLLLMLTACAGNGAGGSTGTNNATASNIKNAGSVNDTSHKNTVDNTGTDSIKAGNSVSSKSIGSSNSTNNTLTTVLGKSSTAGSKTPMTIIIGGKLDTQWQLLTGMYALLLRHDGFTVVVEQMNSKADDAVFNAVVSGQVDLSPVFTANGLGKLGLRSTGIAQLDYLQIKQGYEAKYRVTWLAPAPLNAKVYSSAPVVRDSVLKKSPRIATVLNKLAPALTEQASQQMLSEVKAGKNVTQVATQFLQSKGLL